MLKMIKNIEQFVEYLEKSSDQRIIVQRLLLKYNKKLLIDEQFVPGLFGSIYIKTIGNPDIKVHNFLNEHNIHTGMGYQERREASYMIRTSMESWPGLAPLITLSILANKKVKEFGYSHPDYRIREWV
jgi:hypothetical protein